MLDLDFSKIRSFDGSQDNGFEELICQLAHLNQPENANYFVRKEGAGGDAGVECYWKLLDGAEHAWQAKYFPDRMEDEQWTQISKSVATALDKHPELTKYYVCLPRDWTDSRKLTKSGKPVHSAWLKWEEHVTKWNLLAESKGMKVEFLYWCKHEISLMLQTDNPHFAGRALYWFNEPVIHPQLLKGIAHNSREALGNRFTPENHLDLPITTLFDGLGLNSEWNKHLKVNRRIIVNQLKKLDTDFFGNSNFTKDEKCWNNLYTELEKLANEFLILVELDSSNLQSMRLQDIYNRVEECLETCRSFIFERLEKETERGLKKQWREIDLNFSRIHDSLLHVKSFLFGKAIQAMTSKAAVLVGEAGIGKSHLLCDIALKRLEDSLPTLFLLGQRYSGGNPLSFILDQLDIRDSSYNQVLGALDAAGEAKKTRTLIIIDAINEGHYKDEWTNHLSSFLTEISKYPHLSIILSCRSTYVDYILPDLPEDRLTRINHTGFRGFEHRAAMKYLTNQGISKPSVPITSPEFSNPLFLKTCCKAMQLNGYKSFPKGLQGQSKLFNFYLESIEKIINKKKKYLPGQDVVQTALNHFVQFLYPNNLYGIAVSETIKIINEHDTNPYEGDNLVALLIDEGLLSLDIVPDQNNSRGKEIVRFTYEKFSDHFIAQHIIDQINHEDINSCFVEEGSIGKLLKKGQSISGIIEALGIGFPEKLNREFIEFISEDSIDYDWLFSSSFTDVLQWRAKESFTDKSIELLNMIPSYDGIYKESIDKLLILSTEPEHPWNADFLDRNLRRMKLAERDAFWSTHIAVSDWQEDDGQAESVSRTLIDWSLIANLIEVEQERLRLTSITLLWMTTTSNRKVRDQSTKSLARILSHSPQLIPVLIKNYNNSDDLYLVERLYAAIYGAVCNIKNKEIISELALIVFENIFENGKPVPHILLRDYARGILERAYYKGLLPNEISTDLFRPPYNSDWPIENPSKEEIDKLAGDKFSAIKSSVIGFMGDFGKYTMGCVHDWSPTSLRESKPESCYDIHLKFAETLPDNISSRYIAFLNKKIGENRKEHFNLEKYLESIKVEIAEEDKDVIQEVDEWEVLKDEIKVNLDNSKKEYFRWVSGLGINDRPAKFSRKWAQRWVCKRAYDLGWDTELFEGFEQMYAKNLDRSPSKIERIGKKYQWIAFHELLARMSDNLYWLDRGYSDVDDSQFWGPWQNHLRDLDPTLWIRETKDSGWDEFENSWWQPFTFPFVNDSLEQQKSWLWDRTIIPSFRELLERTNPFDNKKWTVLRGFSKWSKQPEKDEDRIPNQDGWFRINTCIVNKNDIDSVKKELIGKNLCDPGILSPSSTGHQGFLKEYPWHLCYKEMIDWNEPNSDDNWRELTNIKYLVPTNEYEWESSSKDKSLNNSISLYLPNKYLVDELSLSLKQGEYGDWVDSKGNLAFIDPSIKEIGPSYALISSELLKNWLESNNLQLVWVIGGEKQLFTSMASKFFGRLVYSGVYTYTDTGIDGTTWFIEEHGENES